MELHTLHVCLWLFECWEIKVNLPCYIKYHTKTQFCWEVSHQGSVEFSSSGLAGTLSSVALAFWGPQMPKDLQNLPDTTNVPAQSCRRLLVGERHRLAWFIQLRLRCVSQPWPWEENQFLGNNGMNVSELSGNATASTLPSLPLGDAVAACMHDMP